MHLLKKFILFLCSISLVSLFSNCVSTELRFPASEHEIYKNSGLKQDLVMAAQNKILFHFPHETLIEVEKTEIDSKCKSFSEPFWAEKASVYLNRLRSKPEWYDRFHIFEIKKGDESKISLQKDRDGAIVLSIQYVKLESYGKVDLSTQLPCSANQAEYIGRELTKTQFQFPTIEELDTVLSKTSEKPAVDRFNFPNDFMMYLAQRGTILKFTHEMSFEKFANGKFVLAELMSKLSEEVKNNTSQKHIGLWLKKINENSAQASLIQFFSIESAKELKTGIKVDSSSDAARKSNGLKDPTYLFTTYSSAADNLQILGLNHVENCLEKLTKQMGQSFFRKPASDSDKESYLAPGFICEQ